MYIGRQNAMELWLLVYGIRLVRVGVSRFSLGGIPPVCKNVDDTIIVAHSDYIYSFVRGP